MTSDHVDKLVTALEQTGYVKVVKTEEAPTQLRLLCRVSSKKQWCDLLERLLQNKQDWTEHICQQYFLKEGKLVYGWNVVINASDLMKASLSICNQLAAISMVDEGGVGVDSFPLRGAYRSTGASFNPSAPGVARGGSSQKGAFSVGGGGR